VKCIRLQARYSQANVLWNMQATAAMLQCPEVKWSVEKSSRHLRAVCGLRESAAQCLRLDVTDAKARFPRCERASNDMCILWAAERHSLWERAPFQTERQEGQKLRLIVQLAS